MVRSGAPMLQSITKTMSVLLILPLLLAHRHPTQARPKASILRRMPIFYGKRDPALAAPPPASLSAVPASPYLYPAGLRAVLEDFMDKRHHGSPARAGAGGDRGRGVKTGKRGEGGGGSGGAGGESRPPWMTSSVLLTRMEDRLRQASRSEGSAGIFRKGARPHSPLPHSWRQFRQSGEDGEDRQPALSGSGERLRRKLKRLSAALGRRVDTRHDLVQTDREESSYLIPVEGDDGYYVRDVYDGVWSDNAGMADPDRGGDDYGGSDQDFLVEVPGPGGEEDMW